MIETYSIIEGIILGEKPIGLLEERKAEDILASLLSFCGNREFYESKDVVQILNIVKQKIINEAISLKKHNIEKMLKDMRILDFLFLENNPTIEYGIIQLEIIAELQTLRIKKR